MKKLSDLQKEEVRDWWQWLLPESQNDQDLKDRLNGKFGAFSRANRAVLKRCSEPSLVLLEPAFHRLLNRLEIVAGKEGQVEVQPLALVAGLLACVKSAPESDEKSSFAAILGRPKDRENDRPVMSKLRFARLQTATSEEEFYQLARRAIQLADAKADVAELADELLAWVREFNGQRPDKPKDRIQVRWATAYYTAALKLAKPTQSATTKSGA